METCFSFSWLQMGFTLYTIPIGMAFVVYVISLCNCKLLVILVYLYSCIPFDITGRLPF